MSHIRTVYAPGGREAASASLLDWHELLRHSHPSSILYLGQKGFIHITGQKDLKKFNCRLCKEYKSTVPHYQRGTRSPKQPGECIHIDLVGPFTPEFEGHTYMVVTIEEATRFKRSYGIINRAEAHIILKQLRDDYVTDGVTIITVRGDGAGELGRSTYFKKALGNLGIKLESAPPYTHQQHGLVERAVRQITEGGRVQLARAHLGDDFWFSACQDFTMKSNILPHQALGGDTPYERLHHERQPRYQGLRKFGQAAYVHIDKNRKGEFSRGIRSKMRPRAERGILLGSSHGGAAYKVFLPTFKKSVISSAVIFDDVPTETSFTHDILKDWTTPIPGTVDMTGAETGFEADQSRDENSDGDEIELKQYLQTHKDTEIKAQEKEAECDGQSGLRRGTRTRIQFDPSRMPSRTREIENLTRCIEEDSSDEEGPCEECNFTYCMLADTSITVEEALTSPEAEEWKRAITTEEHGLDEKGVLVKAECPDGIRPLKTRYVLSRKIAPDGTVNRYKARRVVQGFHQTYGKDFFETFAPVVGFDTLRLVLGLAAWNSWSVRTIDFKQAYLNSDLKEEIYIKNPDGTTEKLKKALYGLKQAGLEWYKTLKSRILQRTPWRLSQHDSCLYVAEDPKAGRLAVMVVYVDDLLLTGTWVQELKDVQEHLMNKFDGTIMEDPNIYIRIEITRKQDKFFLHQVGYCRTIVESIYNRPVRKTPMPLDCGADLSSRTEAEEKLDLSRYPYRQTVGKLMYLAHMTRPDISNSVRELGQYMHDPCMRHWKAVEHLIRYLATYPSLGLLYDKCDPRQDLKLEGYSDADLAGCKETRRSCIGYVIQLGGMPITWSSKTERSILLSTAESEWTALSRGIRHGGFLLGIAGEVGIDQGCMKWYCDNQAAIKNAKTPGFSGRARFVDIKLKFTRQECESGRVELEYVSGCEQLADGFTKRLSRAGHQKFVATVLRDIRM